MKRLVLVSVIGLAILVGLVLFVSLSRESIPQSRTPGSPTNAPAVTVQPVPQPEPTEQLPAGWKDFRALTERQQLNRITAAMENHTLPTDVLAFFEAEIFNRKHMADTRNNMANALVWQEQPNPQLHLLFIKMLEDTTEDPLWRDYCLQFLSECLKSTSDPEAVKAVIARYSQGKDGIAGTAIVNLAFQEGEGRLQNAEAFSRQIEAQLADPYTS